MDGSIHVAALRHQLPAIRNRNVSMHSVLQKIRMMKPAGDQRKTRNKISSTVGPHTVQPIVLDGVKEETTTMDSPTRTDINQDIKAMNKHQQIMTISKYEQMIQKYEDEEG